MDGQSTSAHVELRFAAKKNVIRVHLYVKDPDLPLQTKICVQWAPNFTHNSPSALTLGVNTYLIDFTPKLWFTPMGLDACVIPKGGIFSNARVNDGSLWRHKLKNIKTIKK